METSVPRPESTSAPSPWLTAAEAAERARCGLKVIYSASRSGRLRTARIGGRRELRFLASWVDDWLLATSEPVEVTPAPAPWLTIRSARR